MKPEDYPLFEYRRKKLRRVPELPENPEDPGGEHRCDMCQYKYVGCSDLIDDLRDGGGPGCGDDSTIFVPKETFQEYVVEFVRRRVG